MSEDRAREVAAEIYRRFRYGASDAIRARIQTEIKNGLQDDDPIVKLIATLASEREAIGRAAGREEAAKVAETCQLDVPFAAGCPDGASAAARQIAAAIRSLPVDGGKDGADG